MAVEGSQGMSQRGMCQPSGWYASGQVRWRERVRTNQGMVNQAGDPEWRRLNSLTLQASSHGGGGGGAGGGAGGPPGAAGAAGAGSQYRSGMSGAEVVSI